MGKKIKIRTKKGWIAYAGSLAQQNYGESTEHGYLLWSIENKDKFDVKFRKLPNPCPYVTINWRGSVDNTVKFIEKNCPVGTGSRFRIFNKDQLSQKDIIEITTKLKNLMLASEVTFKTDHNVNRDVIITGSSSSIGKEDLRNPDVLVKLLKEYHHESEIDDDVWVEVDNLVKKYLSRSLVEDSLRNSKWSLRHLTFDNLLAYGEENIINFEKLNGIVGIFGPNRSGKSSIIGAIMYALFNTTDRGSIKNLHVINARKLYGLSKAVINVNSKDYVIERQTTKNENKRGQINASTALNIFRIDGDEAIDLAGEQRTDTEKVLRKLIGDPEDFLLTSMSTQDEIKMFISQGSTKRRQILSRFLDLDIFDKMYDLAKNDLNASKVAVNLTPNRDWMSLNEECYQQIESCDLQIDEKYSKFLDSQQKLEEVRRQLEKHSDFSPVTKPQVDVQRSLVETLKTKVDSAQAAVDNNNKLNSELSLRMQKIEALQKEHDLVELKRRFQAFRVLETSVTSLKHSHEKEAALLKQHSHALKILKEVPCGEQFPTCKFIKDAHQLKDKLEPQRERSNRALDKLRRAEEAMIVFKEDDLANKIDKIEQLNVLYTNLRVELSAKKIETNSLEYTLTDLNAKLLVANNKLLEFEEAFKNEENAEIVSLRNEITTFQNLLKQLDSEKMQLATERGKIQTLMDKYAQEHKVRHELYQKMRAYELITQAFSRKGIPSIITSSQLPIINSEISKILHGIVDFNVELEMDDETESTEVFIDYGDSRRIIELGSGMEKMIASIAIRVALINVSSLPKTDMFIIDEGFGSLDSSNVEACNRLLTSLKQFFRLTVVISHVDAVKDVADHIIEINKKEKDAHVVYE